MEYVKIIICAILFVFLLQCREITCEQSTEKPSGVSRTASNPLATLTADKNEIENVSNSNKLADEVLSRVRRQYPYYYYRRYPRIPIIFGGGFGPGIGYGGGFGGRGIGGFGGHGIGGHGGIGGFGGGHGGRG